MGSLRRPWLALSAVRPGGAAAEASQSGGQLHAALPLVLGSLLVAMPVATLPGLPVAGLPLGEMQALNRELGRLCTDPPRQALSVCRIHARLVKAL